MSALDDILPAGWNAAYRSTRCDKLLGDRARSLIAERQAWAAVFPNRTRTVDPVQGLMLSLFIGFVDQTEISIKAGCRASGVSISTFHRLVRTLEDDDLVHRISKGWEARAHGLKLAPAGLTMMRDFLACCFDNERGHEHNAIAPISFVPIQLAAGRTVGQVLP